MATGAVLGWTSSVVDDFKHGRYNNITATNIEIGWIGSFATLGALITCIPTGIICDIIGRRTTLLLLIIPFVLGWSFIILAKNILMLYLGRLFAGMGIGMCCVAAPLYTNEIAQKEIRGSLGSYFQLMVTIGILFAYCTGALLPVKIYTICCAAWVAIFAMVFVFQPETPLYYIRKGNLDKARASLKKLRGFDCNIDSELASIEAEVKESTQVMVSFGTVLYKRATVKAIVISLGLMLFQQLSGVNAVILYSNDIFENSGVKFNSAYASIIVAIVMVVATFVASVSIDKLGRKKLLLISSSIMALSCFCLALYFTLKTRTDIPKHTLAILGFLPTLSLCIFIVVFSIGFGPIPWMISTEIFVPQIKSLAGSVAGAFNWFLAFLITAFYMDVAQCVGQDSTFYFFGAMSLLGTIFVYVVVPETKGKSVDEVQSILEE